MKVEFATKLRVELLDSGPPDRWLTLAPFVVRVDGVPLVVPPEYETNFASVPRLPLVYLLAGNTAHRSALVHDWLYDARALDEAGKRFSKDFADDVFYAAMLAEGVPAWRASMMYRAVRLAGQGPYAEAPA